MKKVILIIALLCSAHAWATPGTLLCIATTTSCNYSATPKPGDQLILFSYRSNSATAPGATTGFTSLKTTTGNTNSNRISAKLASGSETTSGTSANATSVAVVDLGSGWITGNLDLGTNYSGITEASGTASSLPALTLTGGLSSSYVICGIGAASGTVTGGISGMTLLTGTAVTTSTAVYITTSTVSSWSTTAGPNPSAINASGCAEFVATPSTVSPISPSDYLVQNIPLWVNNETDSSPYTFVVPFNSASLSNNYLQLDFTCSYATTAVTVSNIYANADTGHATWTWGLNHSVADTSNKTDKFDYGIAGAGAGATAVSVVLSGPCTSIEAHFREFRQIATSSALDASLAVSGSSYPYFTPGAITPTQTNDLIVTDCTQAALAGTSGGGNGTVPVSLPGGTSWLDTSWWYTSSATAFIYNSTADITVQHYYSGLIANNDCTEEAFKTSSGAGTAPTGPHIVARWDQLSNTVTATQVQQMSIAGTGDALFIVAQGYQTESTQQFTGLSDILGNSFTVYAPYDTAGGGYPAIAVDCDVTAGTNLLTFTGAQTHNANHYYFLEISGLANSSHTACVDTTTGQGTCTGAHCIAGAPTAYGSGTSFSNAPSITPSTAGGIVIGTTELGTGAYTASTNITAPACGQWGVATYSGQSDTSQWGSGNMFGFCYNTSTSAQSWSWTNGATSTSWQAIGMALLAPTGGTVVRHRAWVIQ